MFNKVITSTYIKNIITLMSGTLFAQIVMLVMMPVITRIYSPDEFGVFSLFISITGIIGLVSSLKYDQAIMLPGLDRDSESLLYLSVSIIFISCLLIFIVIAIFNNEVAIYFRGSPGLMWLIPIGVFLTGMIQVLMAFSSRHRLYRGISESRASIAVSMSAIQVASRSIYNLDGLVAGKLIAEVVGLFVLARKIILTSTLNIKKINIKRIIINAKRYKNFPKYQSVTVFLNALSQGLPVILLSLYYAPEVAGIYALSVRVLQVPIGLIGASTKEVYYQAASKRYSEGKDILQLYLKTTLGLAKIFIIPFFSILFFGDYLFGFVFGQVWVESGVMSQVLIFWFAFGFINSAALITYSVLGIQKNQMYLEFVSLIFRFSAIYVGYIYYDSYMISITGYMVVSVAVNVFTLVFIYRKLRYKVDVK